MQKYKYKCKNTNINAHKDIDRASFFTLFINLECSSQKGGILKSVGQGGLSRISGLFSPRFLVCLHRVMGAPDSSYIGGQQHDTLGVPGVQAQHSPTVARDLD